MDVTLLNLSVVSSIFSSASSYFFFLDRVSTALKGTVSSEAKIYLPPVTGTSSPQKGLVMLHP
jgi:hypothetical protein